MFFCQRITLSVTSVSAGRAADSSQSGSKQYDITIILPQITQPRPFSPSFHGNHVIKTLITQNPHSFCDTYLSSFKVFLLQLQTVAPPSPSDHFGDSVGDLLHGAFYSVHCRLWQNKSTQLDQWRRRIYFRPMNWM